MKQTACVAIVVAALLFISVSRPAAAQQGEPSQADPVVKRADIYCTGYISEALPRLDLQVIGGDKENQQNTFAQGDVVFLNKGRLAASNPEPSITSFDRSAKSNILSRRQSSATSSES